MFKHFFCIYLTPNYHTLNMIFIDLHVTLMVRLKANFLSRAIKWYFLLYLNKLRYHGQSCQATILSFFNRSNRHRQRQWAYACCCALWARHSTFATNSCTLLGANTDDEISTRIRAWREKFKKCFPTATLTPTSPRWPNHTMVRWQLPETKHTQKLRFQISLHALSGGYQRCMTSVMNFDRCPIKNVPVGPRRR